MKIKALFARVGGFLARKKLIYCKKVNGDPIAVFKDFSARKILQIAYIFQKETHAKNYMRLLKLIFFADRYHIRNYGLLLTFDSYRAMLYGPVASYSYNIFQKESYFMRKQSPETVKLIEDSIKIVSETEIEISPQSEDEISKSGHKAIEFALYNFGRFEEFELSKITHDYPEWEKYEDEILSGKTKSKNMYAIDFFNNPCIGNSLGIKKYLGGIDPFVDDPEKIKDIREVFLEYA